ncbi:hypothetical protein LJB42_002515 [Komagataella kurtzmanii]|nr:hypothetical protein LJB42_002515 [Komagataella kurtzmanii]
MDYVPPDTLPESNLLTAMIAGSVAACAQTALTYPFEFVKTGSQLHVGTFGSRMKHPSSYFKGCKALMIGNTLKASSRFFIFNSASKFMANENGKTTAPRVVVAGLMTGAIETLWVIPFENIKTTIIQNTLELEKGKPLSKEPTRIVNSVKSETKVVRTTKSPTATQQSFLKTPSTTFTLAIKEIYSTNGIRGFLQGSGLTVFRQMANSMVWFSSYNFIKQGISPNSTDISDVTMLGIGMLSSMSVVAITQPIDVVKTRMQSKDAKQVYRDWMTCVVRTSFNEGISKFWAGWLPRLIKVSSSGNITLVTYQLMEYLLNNSMNEQIFT